MLDFTGEIWYNYINLVSFNTFKEVSLMLKLVGYNYKRSKQIVCEFWDEVPGLQDKGYKLGPNTARGIRMVKPCEAQMLFEDKDGERIMVDLRSEILTFYGLKNLRIERFEKFVKDVLDKKITIEKYGEKYVIKKT